MESLNVWGNSLLSAMTTLWSKFAGFVPNLLAFVLILIVGYLVSRAVSGVLRRILGVLQVDRLAARVGISTALEKMNARVTFSEILSRIVYWLLMLTFLVSATESLGLERVSGTIDAFVLYLPNVIGAALILLLGLLLAGMARDLVTSGVQSVGADNAGAIGTTVYGLLAVIVISLAIGQLELETAMLNQVIAIVLLSAGAAAAIAFGFGSRSIAGNVLASTYLRDLLKEGDRITVGTITGTVERIMAVNTEIRTDSGSLVTFPNRRLIESTVERN